MIPVPRIKPAVPNISTSLSDADAAIFREAVKDATRGRWSEVVNAQGQLSDPYARDALRWLRATRDSNAPLSELTYVVHNLTDWPRMTTVRARAEEKLLDNPVGITDIIEWFRGYDPVSGEGRLALAKAYFDRGDTAMGTKWLKLAWTEAQLDRDRQRSVFKAYGKYLTPEDHAARADYLVWQGTRYFPSAQALLGLMPKDDKQLINARMLLRTNGRGMNEAVDAVPERLQGDAGFAYERAYWRRKRKSKEYAMPVLRKIDTPPATERGQDRLWDERRLMAYWALQEKRYLDVYKLTLNHGMTRGGGFASAEFIGGWTALTKLNQPEQAMVHFTTLREGVGMPVSLARAAYWQGRAAEALGRDATGYYIDAAQHVNTFYGQLAADKLSPSGATLTLPPEPNTDFARAKFTSDPRVQAARLFAEAGSETYFTQLSFFLDDEFETPEELALLAQLARDFGYMRPSIRAAKQASRLETMLTETGYPRVPAVEGISDDFEKPFVYAIARQESEFNVSAVSHASAYGLMQMINSTARSTARRHRIPYDRARMTSDMSYSANLGAHHLHDLLEDFDGSYIMAAAAYNAGSSRVHRWNRQFGDPRKGEIDAIDWLESIPFSETRNYVQRIMENMQVYRARMSPTNSAPNQLHRDIYIGSNRS